MEDNKGAANKGAAKNTAALRNIDLRGMLLMTPSIGPFLLVINQGARFGWTSPPILAMLAVCISSSAYLHAAPREAGCR
jgi:hypothetical protein